ncbi:MAG: AAA family ATPase [Candidatus Omnitrophica bacterium]|nr:AAA family ATPase [Candidatus Omnitrophota bacterium]
MYEEYWKLKEKPFENTPDPKFFYHSPNHEEALMRLYYVIRERKGAGLLTGEYGSGKTVLTRFIVRELSQQTDNYKIALIVNPSLSAKDFLKEIIFQLEGREYDGSKLKILHTLNDIFYKGKEEQKDIVVIVDEAQVIDKADMFEELRLLLNFQMNDRFLLSLILVGQPELREKINRLPQLKQRMAISFHLNVLSPQESTRYIEHRCNIAGAAKPLFTGEAMKIISEHSDGIPRRMNTYCELALMQGMLNKREIIDAETATQAVEDINT